MEPTIYFSMFPADVEFEHCQKKYREKREKMLEKKNIKMVPRWKASLSKYTCKKAEEEKVCKTVDKKPVWDLRFFLPYSLSISNLSFKLRPLHGNLFPLLATIWEINCVCKYSYLAI